MSLSKWSFRATPTPTLKMGEWVCRRWAGPQCSPGCSLGGPLMSASSGHFWLLSLDGRFDPWPTYCGWRHRRWGSELLSFWMILPTAVAVPIGAGIRFWVAPQPSWHSCPEGPSMAFWVAVMAQMLVISPSMMLKFSWLNLASRDKQVVVQEALSHFLLSMPTTKKGHKHKGQRWWLPPVSLSLLQGSEDTSGLHSISSLSITPFDFQRISLLEDGNGSSTDDKLPILRLDCVLGRGQWRGHWWWQYLQCQS